MHDFEKYFRRFFEMTAHYQDKIEQINEITDEAGVPFRTQTRALYARIKLFKTSAPI